MKKTILNGIIKPSDNLFEFTAELFEGYLWKMGNDIYVSLVESLFPKKGNFRKVIELILKSGYNVKICTPIGRMQSIVIKNNYEPIIEESENGKVEVWLKRSRSKTNGVAIDQQSVGQAATVPGVDRCHFDDKLP